MKNIIKFCLTLSINLILNFKWSIPAWMLFACHCMFDWPIIWFWIALSLWIVNSVVWMGIISWANRCSDINVPKENKNPYSKTGGK